MILDQCLITQAQPIILITLTCQLQSTEAYTESRLIQKCRGALPRKPEERNKLAVLSELIISGNLAITADKGG